MSDCNDYFSIPFISQTDSGLKDASNEKARGEDTVLAGKESKAVIASAPSERYDPPETSSSDTPWTSAEQKLLEQALITYPKDTVKRWDRIAESIPGRSKESCIKRYKELAAMVQAKKEALKAAAGKTSKSRTS